MRGAPYRAVRAGSMRIYGVLLRRYPREFRDDFGPEMRAAFGRMMDEGARQQGVLGIMGAWIAAVRDAARPLPGPVGSGSKRPREGTTMGGGGRWFGGVGEDVRSAWRSLRREPRFSLLVVGVLAMGFLLNTAVLSVVNAYLIRPLPYPAAERIVQVRDAPGVGWTELDHVFERAVSWDLDVFTIIGGPGAEMVRGSWITPDFMDVYAVRPALGRAFRPEEAEEGAAPVAVISHRLWQERFQGDPGVLGRSFDAFTSDRPDHAESFHVVGVLREDFWYVNRFTDVFAPIREDRQVYVGRLRPDVTLDQATAAITELAASRMDGVPEGYVASLVRLQDSYVAGVRPTLTILQVAVALVMLIACANAVVLLFVRYARREREFSVRRALGARGVRLARQLLAEGVILAVAAAALGVWGAAALLAGIGGAIQTRLGTSAPGGAEAFGLDGTVVALTLGTALAIGLMFGLVPYVMARRGAVVSAFGTRGGGDTRARARTRNVMVAAEVALSMALLGGAGLMVRSAVNLQRMDLGFDSKRITVGEVGLRMSSYPEPVERVRMFDAILAGVRDVPGVESASMVGRAPFGSFVNTTPLEAADAGGTPIARGEVTLNTVDEGYFDAIGIPVVSGRTFGPDDAAGAPDVAVVSETAARRLWPGGDAVGGRLRSVPQEVGSMHEPGEWVTVIGVVGDADYDSRVEDDGQVYTPLRQSETAWMDVIVKSRPGAGPVVRAVAGVVASLDPEIPFADAVTLDELVANATAPTRFTAGALVVFAGFAALLAVMGLYGVVAYAARQRRRDVAVRMALGADSGQVTGLFVRQGLVVVMAGVAAGLLGGFALGRGLVDQLHGVAPSDPLTHGVVAVGLLAAAALAVWVPARTAARVDPMGVLREE